MPAPSRAPSAGSRRLSGGRLVWRAGPLTFELRSPHPAAHARARAILGPWLADPDALAVERDRASVEFTIRAEGAEGDRRWCVCDGEGSEVASEGTLDAALTAVEYRAIAELLLPDSGAAVVHAALLSRDGHGLLIVGPKEAGKSTLACALWARGWSLHSDDGALVDGDARAGGAGAVVRGVPRRASLRAASRRLVGEKLWERVARLPGSTPTPAALLFHPREAGPVEAETARVAAVVFLARRGAVGSEGLLSPIDPARGLVALAPYCNLRDAGFGRALEALQPLADGARFFDLSRGPLPAMIEAVESAVGIGADRLGRGAA